MWSLAQQIYRPALAHVRALPIAREYAKAVSTKASRKKQQLAELRKLRLTKQSTEAAALEEKKEMDFSPKAQKCDLMTALQREEMFYRTEDRPIPEFHAGSILAVEYVDSLSKTRTQRAVGICIAKRNKKLGSNILLRNAVNGVAYELAFPIYSPLVKKIEVLELCRRRRAKLYYLRDRPAKESFVSPNFEPVPRPEGPIPVKKANPNRKKKKKSYS